MPSSSNLLKPPVEVEKIRNVVYRFVDWLDLFGEISQDQYDLWAPKAGRMAKSFYYQNDILGIPIIAPIVFIDTFFPGLRKIVRPKTRFPIADAHYAMSFFTLGKSDQKNCWIDRGRDFLEELKKSKCNGYPQYCWGYPFDWETNHGTVNAGTPIITIIPYCYEAFEAGYHATGDREYLRIQESIAAFVFEGFDDIEVSPGIYSCSYTPHGGINIVNANAYRAYLLMHAGKRFNRQDWQDAAMGNLLFVLRNQQSDGAWFYSASGKDQFIDNFHTCFVLKNLYKIWKITSDRNVFDTIQKGFRFYKRHLIDGNSQPLPFAKAQRPVLHQQELYDYAEGINLALMFIEIDSDSLAIIDGHLRGLLKDWLLPDGHFSTRRFLTGYNKVAYHRWAQSQTFHALVKYLQTFN